MKIAIEFEPAPARSITLTLTLQELHDLVVCVETAKPTWENTARRAADGHSVTNSIQKLRADIFAAAKEAGL